MRVPASRSKVSWTSLATAAIDNHWSDIGLPGGHPDGSLDLTIGRARGPIVTGGPSRVRQACPLTARTSHSISR